MIKQKKKKECRHENKTSLHTSFDEISIKKNLQEILTYPHTHTHKTGVCMVVLNASNGLENHLNFDYFC